MGKQKSGGGGDDNKHEQCLQAVLLADSFTRTFRPLSLDQSKMLSPLNNVAMIDYAMEFLAGAGVEELFVVCCREEMETHVENNSWSNTSMQVTVVKDGSINNAGDALRELDKRNLVQSDPFILMYGDTVTNVDIAPVLEAHKKRKKKDNTSIMTMLFKQVGTSWDALGDSYSKLRATHEDLIVGLNPQQQNRILVYDDHSHGKTTNIPCSFFASNAQVELRDDLLDCGIDICSPDVLARFSDEFDYRDMRREFVANSVAEEEEGLQNKIFAHLLAPSEYAARVHDFCTYAAISNDLLRRWCYPVVPDNLPSGYEKQYRYALKRHYLYKEMKQGQIKVGRSTALQGAGMVGSECHIGADCTIEGTVLGNECHIGSNVTLKDCHLWSNVNIADNVEIVQSILADDVVVKTGAKIGRGCIIGKGCIIGENVVVPQFTNITMMEDKDGDDDDFGGFSDDEEDSEEDEDAAEGTNVIVSDHDVVGKDGQGKVWQPVNDDDDDDDDDEANISPLDRIKMQTIGFDPSELYKARAKMQSDDADEFSDDDETMSRGEDFGGYTDGAVTFGGDSGMMGGGAIVGRQKGIDVVKELKIICLEHEETAPVENLAIELNSFKFSQNASYSDCTMAAILAILEKMEITSSMSAGQLVASLKKRLSHWGPLLQKMSIGIEEEKSIILGLERAATASGEDEMGITLSKEPAFRFVLQTLHDEEIVSEEAVLAWAAMRREDDADDDAAGKLFHQKPTQDFLEWLAEEDSDDDDDDDSDDDDDDSDDE